MTDVLTLNGNVLVSSGSALTGDIGGSTEEDFSPGVDFIDYDGTTVERWAAADVASKTALPSNPSHSRLTAQGWNWALADIKTYMTNHPDALMTVGQMYTTASGDTEIDCTFPAESLSPYLCIAPNGTVEVDWGDGSTKDTITGINNTIRKYQGHTYATAGNYTIKLHVTSGNFAFYIGSSSYSSVFSITNETNTSREYSNCITGIYIGKDAIIGYYGLSYLLNLKYLTLPTTVTITNTHDIAYSHSLVTIIVPNTITTLEDSTFRFCLQIKKISLPKGLTTIGQYTFSQCYQLQYLTIPDSVTTINNNAYEGTYALKKISLSNGLTSLASYFLNGSRIIESIIIPNGVTSLSNSVFTNAFNLKELILSSTLTSIGGSTFTYIGNLKTITIPATVTSIANGSFTYCWNLLEIHFKPTIPPTLGGSSVFTQLNTNCKIYVPTGYLSAYTGATNYPSSSTYTYLEE